MPRSSYYDQIVRDGRALKAVRQYGDENPARWA
jgi:hypothetical protein